jgi:2-methylcitrate dehydratase PrpD
VSTAALVGGLPTNIDLHDLISRNVWLHTSVVIPAARASRRTICQVRRSRSG